MSSHVLVTVTLRDAVKASNLLIQCVYYANHTARAGLLHSARRDSVYTWQWSMFGVAALH
jgi:hypothetical protein